MWWAGKSVAMGVRERRFNEGNVNIISFHPHSYPSESGLPSLWNLTPDDVTWIWSRNSRYKVHSKRNVLQSSPNHPPSPQPCWSIEKLSSMKPVPGAKKVGDCCSEISLRPQHRLNEHSLLGRLDLTVTLSWKCCYHPHLWTRNLRVRDNHHCSRFHWGTSHYAALCTRKAGDAGADAHGNTSQPMMGRVWKGKHPCVLTLRLAWCWGLFCTVFQGPPVGLSSSCLQ